MTFAYGWCGFCPNFTYHDLVHGACGDCWHRWRKYPETMPVHLRRVAAQPEGQTP